MYRSHYSLDEKPFQITTDPKFLWLGEKHREALSMLRYGILDNKGFLLLTGDVGTGKTTVINALLRDLGSNTIVATVVDPDLDKLEFLRFLANAFEIEGEFTTKVDFLNKFRRFLNNACLRNKSVLLIVDEAQKLSRDLLEEIRLLSNIEKENTKLLNIALVGQNEFNEVLTENDSRAIRQRITTTYQIDPLTQDETRNYIEHRLKIAGTEEEIFSRKAIREIYDFSGGYPRLINVICDLALLAGFVQGLKTISPVIIKECAQELTLPGEARPNYIEGHPAKMKLERRLLKRALLYATLLPIIISCLYLVTALGLNESMRNVKSYYGQIFGSLGGSSSRYSAEKTHALEQKQLTLFRPVPPAEVHHKPILTPANVEQKDSLGDTNRSEVPQANEPISEIQHDDAVVSKQDVTDAAMPDSLDGGEEPLLSSDFNLVIAFNYDTNELPAKAYDALDQLAAIMGQHLDTQIVVKGYTDTLGTSRYNKRLSQFRANSVKSYLVAKGIRPSRIWTFGMGDETPLEPNTTAAGRRRNRRVEIELHRAGRR